MNLRASMPKDFTDNFNVLLNPVQRITVETFLNVTRPAIQRKYADKKETLSRMKATELTGLTAQWIKRITESKGNENHGFQSIADEGDKRIQEIDNHHKRFQELAEAIDEEMILELEMAYSNCIGSILRNQPGERHIFRGPLLGETHRLKGHIPNFGNEERRSDGSILPSLGQ